jgi:hypothetical protein
LAQPATVKAVVRAAEFMIARRCGRSTVPRAVGTQEGYGRDMAVWVLRWSRNGSWIFHGVRESGRYGIGPTNLWDVDTDLAAKWDKETIRDATTVALLPTLI